MTKTQLTEAIIESCKTASGGWTRKQLSDWGVPWPPPAGWKKKLIAKGSPLGRADFHGVDLERRARDFRRGRSVFWEDGMTWDDVDVTALH